MILYDDNAVNRGNMIMQKREKITAKERSLARSERAQGALEKLSCKAW